MADTKFRQRKTPGVYVTELNAFPPSIIGVPTAIPGFIGYTEFAEISGKPMYFKPIRIQSLVDFEEVFGGSFKQSFTITPADASPGDAPTSYDFLVEKEEFSPPSVVTEYYSLNPENDAKFNLYESMRLFYDNGGGDCYVVSVGSYVDESNPDGVAISLDQLEDGLSAMGEQIGPTMLVVPDAVLLPADSTSGIDVGDIPTSQDFGKLTTKMLEQCGSLQDRVAILDVYGASALTQDPSSGSFDRELTALTDYFRTTYVQVTSELLRYGMAYFPFLKTSVIGVSEIDYTNVSNITASPADDASLTNVLETEADDLYGPYTASPVSGTSQRITVQGYIDAMSTTHPNDVVAVSTLNNNLVNALPLLQQIENIIAEKLNMLPPSGAMAGVFTKNDQTRGVWNAPANYQMVSVTAPSVNLNDKQQGNLNVPLDGKAIDVIREFVSRGIIVWGARTLDGNSQDWRYIQVRRTLIYIEQSVKTALDPFVFAANDGNTWTAVVSMVSNFLQGLWSQGGLMGATADEAFTVECGLGTTMTATDVLDGYMIVQITLQMIRPAEFIELTFKQKMEGA